MHEGRIRRLTEELGELNSSILDGVSEPRALIEELSYALRPLVHERRIPNYGAFVDPVTELPHWAAAAGFGVSRRMIGKEHERRLLRLKQPFVGRHRHAVGSLDPIHQMTMSGAEP